MEKIVSSKGEFYMCLICDRIAMIKNGTNPYFVKELETGYVVIGDYQHFKGYTLLLFKEHKTDSPTVIQSYSVYALSYSSLK